MPFNDIMDLIHASVILKPERGLAGRYNGRQDLRALISLRRDRNTGFQIHVLTFRINKERRLQKEFTRLILNLCFTCNMFACYRFVLSSMMRMKLFLSCAYTIRAFYNSFKGCTFISQAFLPPICYFFCISCEYSEQCVHISCIYVTSL